MEVYFRVFIGGVDDKRTTVEKIDHVYRLKVVRKEKISFMLGFNGEI